MKKTSTIYEEKSIIVVKYNHSRCREYLQYDASVKIKNSGKLPVQLTMKFDDIYPDMAPMPPEEHSIKASSIIDLQSKLTKWFQKFGYILQ